MTHLMANAERLDSVPYPTHVLDKDMKWVFLNRPFEQLMIVRHKRD